MATKLSPIGFWSYARQDDERKLNRLRLQLSFQVQQRYGREHVKIFQDVSAIPPGADWEAKIRSALMDSAFLIPIITPNFLESRWCDEEFFIFLEKERALEKEFPELSGQKRIFPIHYVDVEGVDGFSPGLVPELRRAQWLDFRDLIYKDPESEDVLERLGELAKSICQLLRDDRKLMADREAGIIAPAASSEIGSVGATPAGIAPAALAAVPRPDAAPATQVGAVPGAGGSRKPLIAGSAIALAVAAGLGGAMLFLKPKAPPPIAAASDPASTAAASQNAPPTRLSDCVQSVVDKARVIEKGARTTIAQATSAARAAEDRANAEKAAHPGKPSAPPEGSWQGANGLTWVYWGDTQDGQPSGLGITEFSNGGRHAGQYSGPALEGYAIITSPADPGARPMRTFSRFEKTAYVGFVAREDPDGSIRMDENRSGQWVGYGAVLFPDGSELMGQLPDGDKRIVAALYSRSGEVVNAGYFKDTTYLGPFDGPSCPV